MKANITYVMSLPTVSMGKMPIGILPFPSSLLYTNIWPPDGDDDGDDKDGDNELLYVRRGEAMYTRQSQAAFTT
jgi:hypothetical protein